MQRIRATTRHIDRGKTLSRLSFSLFSRPGLGKTANWRGRESGSRLLRFPSRYLVSARIYSLPDASNCFPCCARVAIFFSFSVCQELKRWTHRSSAESHCFVFLSRGAFRGICQYFPRDLSSSRYLRSPLSLTHELSRKASSAFIIFPHFYLVLPARASFALLASAFLFNRSSFKYKRDDSSRALRSRRTNEYGNTIWGESSSLFFHWSKRRLITIVRVSNRRAPVAARQVFHRSTATNVKEIVPLDARTLIISLSIKLVIVLVIFIT